MQLRARPPALSGISRNSLRLRRTPLSLAILAALSATDGLVPQAQAVACPAPSGGQVLVADGVTVTETGLAGCELSGGDALIVENAGAIEFELDSPYAAVGVLVDAGNTAVDIENRGTIDIANASSSAIGIGIYRTANATGAILNSGTITVIGSNTPAGILVDGQVDGGISNTGTITAAGGAAVSVWGVVTGGISNVGTMTGLGALRINGSGSVDEIINSGTLAGTGVDAGGLVLSSAADVETVVNLSTGDITSDFGSAMYLRGTVGTIDNQGRIDGAISGVHITGGATVTDAFSNSGTIQGNDQAIRVTTADFVAPTVVALQNSGLINLGDADGDAIVVDGAEGNVGFGLNNSGTVASGTDSGSAFVIRNDGMTGDIVNAEGGIITAADYGLYIIASSLTGDFTNSGSLTASSGVVLTSATMTGDLDNLGSITASDRAIDLSNSSVTGNISNSGSLSGSEGIYLAAGTVNGSISNSGTITGSNYAIQLDAASSVTGGISNSGLLDGAVELADATLTLTGSSGRITGAVTGSVNSTVMLNGDFTTENTFNIGHFEIADGASLDMRHSISASSPTTFVNAGTLIVNADQAPTITGNFSQLASGILQIGAVSSSEYGQLTIDGTATLPSDAKIFVDVASVNTLAGNETLADVLSATSLISDGSFVVTDNSAMLGFTAVLDGNTVDLVSEVVLSATQAVTAQSNSPAYAAAAVLDDLMDAGGGSADMAAVITTLAMQPSLQAVSQAVTETLPLLNGDAGMATRYALAATNQIVQQRMASYSDRQIGDELMVDRYLWARPFGGWGDQDGSGHVAGFESDSQGVIIGADGALSASTRLGVAVSYAETDVDSDSTMAPHRLDIESWQLYAYGNHALGVATELNVQLDIGHHNLDGLRSMPTFSREAHADYDSLSYHFSVGAAQLFTLNTNNVLSASLRAEYLLVDSDSYTESGAGALNLVASGQDSEELVLWLGATHNYQLNNSTQFSMGLEAGYDTLAEQQSIRVRYAGGGSSFVSHGLDPDPWLGRASVQLLHQVSDATDFSVTVEGAMRDDYVYGSLSARVRWVF
ncbi:autotransporter domain-containing protein [Pseudomaricurvus sp. HS19]|uniref:autotransporter outer membrane beta-barrel domain-containing protein n=1 Tax=Pseudomaricurvus sp. HS19 TaxID=2692626 RepID=UPI00136C6535|nr:autotransporter domain-containing protein [Pseudomaricurvus sp. HS19]MYM64786.1 autotransporter domain-containing protein [Pseudomaricurvus sp. HS19]